MGWLESWKILRVNELTGAHVLPYFRRKYGAGGAPSQARS